VLAVLLFIIVPMTNEPRNAMNALPESPATDSPPAGAFSDVCLGTDLVYVPRLMKIYRRYGAAFFRKLLTAQEWDYCDNAGTGGDRMRIRRASARIAVKEAVSKALGCGLNGLGWAQGVGWRDIEVVSVPQSPPQLRFSGEALERATAQGLHHWRVSISHDGDYAMATVIGLVASTTP
jgi:holo-[acyl-carrier protein] synthase